MQGEPPQDCLEFSNDSHHYRERDSAILINLTKVVQNDYICNWMPVEAYYSYPPAFSTLSKRGTLSILPLCKHHFRPNASLAMTYKK